MTEAANTTLSMSEVTKHDPAPRDRDSGIFLSEDDQSLPSTPASSRPVSIVSLHNAPSIKLTPSLTRTESTRIDRLKRPAELNLGLDASASSSKPKSELELRFDLIRNSQTQSKAALKSPTQLLKDRLNLSPKKGEHEKEVRQFIPPRPMLNGCILPGPEKQMEAFTGRDVRAQTGKGRPAWWCRFDKLVIFDGAEKQENGDMKLRTRTSKGLVVARRRGDLETVIIPMDCEHCQEMLNRTEWKYDMRVCRRSVCWDCTERCRWEMEQEHAQKEDASKPLQESAKTGSSEANRERADSVMQDQQVQEEELVQKAGIEARPQSPIEAVGSIGERLEEML